MSTPQGVQRRATAPQPEDRQPQPLGFGTAVGAGVVAAPIATAGGTAAGIAATAPAVAALLLAGKTFGAILKGLARFFALSRARHRWAILRAGREAGIPTVPVPGARWPQTSLVELLDDETKRQSAFERKAMERVARDARKALNLPGRPLPPPDAGKGKGATGAGGGADVDAGKGQKRRRRSPKPGEPGSGVSPRKALLDKAAARERFYERLRAEAMMARSLAAIDRVVLHREDPEGAVWLLGKHVQQHTADCIAAAKVGFWPWEALAVYHPVAHVGCQCRLESRAKAKAAGLWADRPSTMTVTQAITRMQAIKALGHGH